MKRTFLAAAIAVATLAGSSAQAATTVVNFDDLSGQAILADGYGGIIWNGTWAHYDGAQDPYNPASPDQRVFDVFDGLAGVFNFAGPVVFDGAFFSGFDIGAVQFELSLGGNVVHTSGTLSPNATPTFLSSGYAGNVDQVRVLSPGGEYYVMDDVTYSTAAVPEPATWALMIGGFGLAGASLRRRARVAVA